MANWKKVLVSGSQIEVAGITASAIPSSGGFDDRVVVFDTDGRFKSVLQSNIQGVTTAQFTVSGSSGIDTSFDATQDNLLITGSANSITSTVSTGTNQTIVTLGFTEGANILSSSAQIADEISGSFTSLSSSLSASIATNINSIATNASNLTTVSSSLSASIATNINSIATNAGTITTVSGAFATTTTTNATNIANNDTDIANLQTSASNGIRFVEDNGAGGNIALASGSSIGLGTTMSFAGTANEVEVSHSLDNGGKLTFGLPDDVIIENDLTVNNNLTVLGIELIEGQASVVSGALQVGSGSTVANIATLGNHQFTGSIDVTGSIIADGTATIGTLAESDETTLTQIVVHDSNGLLESAGAGIVDAIQGVTSSLSSSVATSISASISSTNDISASFASTTTTNISNISTNADNIGNNDTDIAALQTSASNGIFLNLSADTDAGHSIGLLETASFTATNNFTSNGFTVATGSSNVINFIIDGAILSGSGLVSQSSQIDIGETSGTSVTRAFATMSVFNVVDGGLTEVLADGNSDNLIISGGAHITMSANAGTDTISISSTDQDVSVTNLELRLAQIDSNVTIGNAGTVDTTISGDLTVTNDLTVNGNLQVLNNFTNLNVTNANIEDQFILLNSASGAEINDKDGGFIVDQATGVGTAFYYDNSAKAWGLIAADGDATSRVSGSATSTFGGGLSPDLFVNTVSQSAANPVDAPAYGAAASGDAVNPSDTRLGSMHVNSTTAEIWIYA